MQREDDNGNVRKRLKRSADGEITVPCLETNVNLKKKVQEEIF